MITPILFVVVNALSSNPKLPQTISTPDEQITELITAQSTCVDTEPPTTIPYVQYYTEQDVVDIAKVLYSECRGVPSKTEQACVAWTILNRVDKYNSNVYSVVRSPNQFAFYDNLPVWDELADLSRDVLERWSREKNGETNVGRVLPKEYLYFSGYGGHNHFRDRYNGCYNIWDYSFESPYEN
jgi:hypothetical protein